MSFRVVRRAHASWQGTVASGGGRITLGSGAFEGPCSLRAPAGEGERAANPGELLGAAVFTELAARAKDCTISRALTGTHITVEASVAGH